MSATGNRLQRMVLGTGIAAMAMAAGIGAAQAQGTIYKKRPGDIAWGQADTKKGVADNGSPWTVKTWGTGAPTRTWWVSLIMAFKGSPQAYMHLDGGGHCLIDQPGKLKVLRGDFEIESDVNPALLLNLGKSVGTCGLPDGFYRVEGNDTVYYLYSPKKADGKYDYYATFTGSYMGTAYCGIKAVQQWKNYVGARGGDSNDPQRVLNVAPAGTNLFTRRTSTGVCPDNLPA